MDKQLGAEVVHDAADRVALLVIRAALLIHLHAKNVKAAMSKGILELYRGESAASYASAEGFNFVAGAWEAAAEAIRRFNSGGRTLESDIGWLVGPGLE
ncbi:hypothetical protein IMZ48_25200 [Candidatus Bathyarchaeota archaeon]|nr:hypothetical protein [Candidatus Bathyarchaeota archaeon]